ncbi:MAG: FlgD immunoglobulin-like domain containing protein [Chloroflexota bacterium]
MRKTAIALVAILVAGLGVLSPSSAVPVRAASANPKVAIIVGATGSVTASYKSAANELYAEAIKYTPNVVKVYSPNATWSKVKSAVNGASIIVYLGHGNGTPSPYPNDPAYTTKDGFGLNATASGSDSNTKYYGEPSIRTLTPAPNAVVLLFHLCYASGNSEPGNPDPSLSVARQRADNYAAGFLRMGARAVIAIGHSHDPYYIRALFTMRQSIRDYWTQAPGFHNHVLQYASVRTPGKTELLDPDKATPWGFWRSLTGDMTLNTADVTGAAYANTGGDPAKMAVPGNATPTADGTNLYASPEDAVALANPVAQLPASTIVRIDGIAPVKAADGSPIYAVHLDDGTTSGFMVGSSLKPRDSLAPKVWTVDAGAGVFSPDGNGAGDTLPISVRLSESSTWTLAMTDDEGNVLASSSGTGEYATITWAPAANSLPAGTYHWNLTATDAYGNGPLEASGDVAIEFTAPEMTLAVSADAGPRVFTPNGDGVGDTIGFALTSNEDGTARAVVRDENGATVDSISTPLLNKAATLTWDGGDLPDGTYTLRFAVRDLAGNSSVTQERTVVLDGALGFVSSSKAVFYPQDGDALAPTTTFGFTLAAPATVDWTVVDAAGTVVRTIKTAEALDAGDFTFAWDGRNDAGAFVPRGTYRSTVVATDGLTTLTQRAAVVADAFRVIASDLTPARGQKITVTAYSAESLDAAPKLAVIQPGISGWAVSMSKVSAGVYRATITLKSSHTGTLRLKVYAPDANGKSQQSNLYLPLH